MAIIPTMQQSLVNFWKRNTMHLYCSSSYLILVLDSRRYSRSLWTAQLYHLFLLTNSHLFMEMLECFPLPTGSLSWSAAMSPSYCLSARCWCHQVMESRTCWYHHYSHFIIHYWFQCILLNGLFNRTNTTFLIIMKLFYCGIEKPSVLSLKAIWQMNVNKPSKSSMYFFSVITSVVLTSSF